MCEQIIMNLKFDILFSALAESGSIPFNPSDEAFNQHGLLKQLGAVVFTVRDLVDHFRQQWPTIREQLLTGTYQPQPGVRLRSCIFRSIRTR